MDKVETPQGCVYMQRASHQGEEKEGEPVPITPESATYLLNLNGKVAAWQVRKGDKAGNSEIGTGSYGSQVTGETRLIAFIISKASKSR